MRPGRNDVAVHYQISGLQLTELQKYTGDMCEAYGLDGRIYKYKGTRPIALYRWDLDCILDVIDLNLNDARNYPDQLSNGFMALSELRRTLKSEYQKTYKT